MRVDHFSSVAAPLQLPARAARRAAEAETAAPAAASAAAPGKNVRATPENLPSSATEKPGHATGLERAIEQLQGNVAKNPQAEGLLHALERLQDRQAGGAVDTLA